MVEIKIFEGISRMKFLVFILFAFVFLLPLSTARNFIVYNVSNPSQNYFVVNGTTGYVGIGTSTPVYPLDVQGSGRFTGDLYVGGTIHGNVEGSITTTGNLNMNGYDIYNVKNVNATNLFASNAVGIGTNTVLNQNIGAKLDVKGNGVDFLIQPGYLGNTANSNWVTLDVVGNKNIYIWDTLAVSGKVGIGTTSPASKLDVFNPSGNSSITIRSGTASWYHIYQPYNNNQLRISVGGGETGSTDIMTFSGSKVGIGTTSPGYTLDVAGTIKASSDVRAPIFYDSDNTGYYVNPAGTSIITNLRIKGWDAKIQSIDSQTGYMYDLIGTYHGWNPNWVYIAGYNVKNNPNYSNATAVAIGGSGSTIALFDIENQKVGIGTTTPQALLDVNGNAIISGDLTVMHNLRVAGNITYVNAQTLNVNGSLIPPLDNWFDLGNSSNRWANIYAVNGYFTNIQAQNINGGSPVTGSGSTNYLAKWTGSSSLGNSVIYDDGTNVGIGTTSPGEKLEVVGNAYFSGTSGNGVLRLVPWSSGTFYFELYNSSKTGSGSKFYFSGYQGSPQVLTIDIPNGRVGIDTTNPQQALDVNGNINLANNAKIGFNNDLSGEPRSIKLRSGYSGDEGNAGTIAYRPSWDSGALAIVGAGGSPRRVRIWDALSIGYNSAPSNGIAISGGMGIGTASPSEKLEVVGNVKASKFIDRERSDTYIDLWGGTTTGSWIKFPDNAWGGGGDTAYIHYYNDSTGENTRLMIYIGNDAADDMYLKSSGPITFESTVSNYIQSLDELRAPRFVDKDNTAYYLDPSSNTNSLKVAGGIELSGPANTGVNLNGVKILVTNYDNDDSNPTSIIFAKDENGYVDFFVNSSTTQGGLPLMYFRGKVGIGTTNPGEKLEVNGNIKLSSSNPVINLNGVAVKKIGSTIVISDVV